ncbi:hypothetical protein DAEQUDRAFT_728943 [Daedalea quercina L-15889]|uniref:Uncharacterized protein n=1 Tax=Daedalea quercina L-15889 TaxID=1314783 RepID=A0A165NXS0_9APHY|nr:hypothetical protein DAEQUDRAFT_728943 [Daedalea quercina L-15889]
MPAMNYLTSVNMSRYPAASSIGSVRSCQGREFNSPNRKCQPTSEEDSSAAPALAASGEKATDCTTSVCPSSGCSTAVPVRVSQMRPI